MLFQVEQGDNNNQTAQEKVKCGVCKVWCYKEKKNTDDYIT